MQIKIEPHTLLRANERGTSEQEIIETINSGEVIEAKSSRKGKSKVFAFGEFRNGKFYEQKKVEVFYMTEIDEIITVTVYVFFGKFEL